MSLTSKVALGGSIVFACGMIYYVHYKQYSDRQQLHQGVIRDIERRQRRKTENLLNLQKQIDLAKELRMQELNSDDVT
ncbi:hypothetical protein ABEB36_008964 [Hypothenemus hampei]|uniref:Uncharacterized protein n=1 Tax=Hypothenemus hampei TaxID=57062 RepID=A0ABD1ENN6_HYPHA